MLQSRLGSSSRPMMKSRNTTPSSAKVWIASTSSTRPKPQGPMAMPARRYPATEPRPSRCESMTVITADAK